MTTAEAPCQFHVGPLLTQTRLNLTTFYGSAPSPIRIQDSRTRRPPSPENRQPPERPEPCGAAPDQSARSLATSSSGGRLSRGPSPAGLRPISRPGAWPRRPAGEGCHAARALRGCARSVGQELGHVVQRGKAVTRPEPCGAAPDQSARSLATSSSGGRLSRGPSPAGLRPISRPGAWPRRPAGEGCWAARAR